MKLPPGHGAPAAHAYGGFGRAMLESMGWSRRARASAASLQPSAARAAAAPPDAPRARSGKGLGKNEDGMCDALAPKRKEDTAGVRRPGNGAAAAAQRLRGPPSRGRRARRAAEARHAARPLAGEGVGENVRSSA
jgi:hypothetical protein